MVVAYESVQIEKKGADENVMMRWEQALSNGSMPAIGTPPDYSIDCWDKGQRVFTVS